MSATFGVFGIAKSLAAVLVKPFAAVFLAVPVGAGLPFTLIAATI